MKYQQLENLEAGWKWQYLIKKHKDGESITRYIDTSEIEAAVTLLHALEPAPTQVIEWISNHMAVELDIKLKQAIRAKRKRYFNAEQEHTRKKSIDLDFRVWERLSLKAQELDATLSDTIEYLITEAGRSQHASKKVSDLRQDLSELLGL